MFFSFQITVKYLATRKYYGLAFQKIYANIESQMVNTQVNAIQTSRIGSCPIDAMASLGNSLNDFILYFFIFVPLGKLQQISQMWITNCNTRVYSVCDLKVLQEQQKKSPRRVKYQLSVRLNSSKLARLDTFTYY